MFDAPIFSEPPLSDDDTNKLPPFVVPNYVDPEIETVTLTEKGERALAMMREKYVKLADVRREYHIIRQSVFAMRDSSVTHNQRLGQIALLLTLLEHSLVILESDTEDGIPF